MFRINGEELEAVTYPLSRPDVERLYWFLPHSGDSGFVSNTQSARDVPRTDLVLEYVDRRSDELSVETYPYYFPDPALDRLPLPGGKLMTRVHGNASPSSFRLAGYTNYVNFRGALERVLDRDYSDYSRILDWGCGCGRLTRYLPVSRGTVVGVDIDVESVRWCRANLPQATFVDVPLHPPTTLAESSFDLVLGVSVFTHLRRAEQDEWLAELRRLAAPGATLLMTVHGEVAACRSRLDRGTFERWQAEGYLDAQPNPALADVISEVGYYRNAFHTADYVRREWSRYFDVVEVLPGFVGNFQDLVIMRNRG